MSFDDRLEALRDRHEALAQSVEMLLATSREQGNNIDKVLRLVETDAENIRSLARIAEARGQ